MKQTYFLLLIMLFLYGCSREENTTTPLSDTIEGLVQKEVIREVPQGDLFSAQEIDKYMYDQVQAKNDFSWENCDFKVLISAANITQLVAIGYQPASASNVRDNLHKINIKNPSWKNSHDELVNFIVKQVNEKFNSRLSASDIIIEDDNTLPVLIVRVGDPEILTALFNLKNVRYIEPYGYWPSTYISRVASSSGCSGSTTALNVSDYTTISPGSKLSWNFNNVNIPAAWNITQGQGITVGVIDAGISSSQSAMNANWNNGESNVGCTITSDYTYGSSAFTSCTHGTSMSGIVAGPRNDLGLSTGIAYKSNLHFIRACADVVLDESGELSGVRNALTRMGAMSSIKIISMSVGTPFSSSSLLDGVSYAYNNGKMIFAAAGTSFSWTGWWGVIYPARYSQCYAVTGVKEDGSKCSECHDGSQVKFTVPMARTSNSGRTTLSLPLSGNSPSYVGGSSCATAMGAGIAALVWSVNPNLTRSQVYNCLKNTAQFYPYPSGSKGYGNLNAHAAVVMAQSY